MAKTEKVRFYRASLPKLVWDAEEQKTIARFDSGTIITDDPALIKKLRKIGYPEVDLDAKKPPPIKTEIVETKDIPVLPPNVTEEQVAARLKAKARVEAKKKEILESEKKKPRKEAKKKERRAIKRRTKKE